MKIINFKLQILLFLSFNLFLFNTALADSEVVNKSEYVGVVSLSEDFKIFPQGRFNNAVYKNNEFLFRKENVCIIDIKDIVNGYIFYGKNVQGEIVVDIKSTDKYTFKKIGKEIYDLKKKDGLTKLFRIYQNKIQDLLPFSQTARGATEYNNNSVWKAAFYHIIRKELISDPITKTSYNQYVIGFHIVESNQEKILNLRKHLKTNNIFIKLTWINEYTLSATESNGVNHKINIKNN